MSLQEDSVVVPVCSAGEMIEHQARLNDVDNITWICAVMGGESGNIGVARRSNSYAKGAEARDPVADITLAQLAADRRLSRIDLLKLDCEGAEWDILPASEDALSRVRQICMEFHCERGWTGEKLADWLRIRGFEVRHTPGRWNGLLWARRVI